jgi:hypothetical protein
MQINIILINNKLLIDDEIPAIKYSLQAKHIILIISLIAIS